jgi:hypothetical protein
MAKKLKIKEQMAIISSNIDSIGCAIERKSKEDRELEREKLKLEREKLNWEMKTKDRVDISLKEYTNLKDENFHYRRKCRQLEEMLARIKIEPFIDKIIEPSLQVSTMKDTARLTTRVNIQFDCNGVDLDFRHEIDPFRFFRND